MTIFNPAPILILVAAGMVLEAVAGRSDPRWIAPPGRLARVRSAGGLRT